MFAILVDATSSFPELERKTSTAGCAVRKRRAFSTLGCTCTLSLGSEEDAEAGSTLSSCPSFICMYRESYGMVVLLMHPSIY